MGDEAEVCELRVKTDEGGEEGDAGDHEKRQAKRCWGRSEEDRGGERG